MYDWLFFDLDGTLTDPAEGITNSVVHALECMGYGVPSYETLCTFIGPPLNDSFHNIGGVPEDRLPEAIFKYREYFSTKGIFENKVYPGIADMLDRLQKAGKKLVVATSKPEDFSVRIIEHFGLARFFENVCGSCMDETRTKKGEVIEYALERNAIKDRSRVLMIGDRKHDVIGAHENGIACCGVLYGYGPRTELEEAGADLIATDLTELETICLK